MYLRCFWWFASESIYKDYHLCSCIYDKCIYIGVCLREVYDLTPDFLLTIRLVYVVSYYDITVHLPATNVC